MKECKNLTPAEQRTCERIANDPRLLKHVLKIVRESGEANHKFDLNLAEGVVSEQLFNRILTGEETVEVKRDFKVSETGACAIELAHNHGRKKTGLTTTGADWWAIIFDGDQYEGEVIIFIKPDRLKKIVDSFGWSHFMSGRGGRSNFKIVDMQDLLAMNFELKTFTGKKRMYDKRNKSD